MGTIDGKDILIDTWGGAGFPRWACLLLLLVACDKVSRFLSFDFHILYLYNNFHIRFKTGANWNKVLSARRGTWQVPSALIILIIPTL